MRSQDLGFVRSDGKTLVPQPHLHFDDSKMWTLDDVRGHTLASPLTMFRALTPEAAGGAAAEYRKGFTINAVSTDARRSGGRLRPAPGFRS